MKDVWKKYTAHKNNSIHVLIKYGCWEGHDQSYAHDQSCTLWTTQRSSANVWKIELVFTSVRDREHIKHTRKIWKNDLQKVILLSDVCAWLSNTIANGSVRQTQKHFTNFMCSSFVFWLAEEMKCSSTSQASCFSAPSCNPAWYQHNCAFQNLRGVEFSYFTKLQILEIICSCLGNMEPIYTWELWLQQDPPHKKYEIKSKSQDTFAGPKVERAMWIHLKPLRV